MTKKYRVTLSPDERDDLERMVTSGRRAARTLTRARVLLKADQADGGPAWDDARIADALGCGVRTVERVRGRFVEDGVDAALSRKPQCRPSRLRALDGAAEAHPIPLACSEPPRGRFCRTMQLFADRLVELVVVPAMSAETVRLAMKRTSAVQDDPDLPVQPGQPPLVADGWSGLDRDPDRRHEVPSQLTDPATKE